MRSKRFTPGEIATFQDAVARGAAVSEVAREHGFSPSTFRRWQRRYGMRVIPYEPNADDLRAAAAWRSERTVGAAWKVYRSFASDPRWEADGELPVFEPESPTDEFERLLLRTRPDARVVLVCEKMSVLDAADTWA